MSSVGAESPKGRRDRIAWRPRVLDEGVASVRMRCFQPMRELTRRGMPVELFDRGRADRYAAVVYTKVYDDAARAEAAQLQQAGAAIVLDLCDNHFYFEDPGRKLEQKAANLRRMIALADRVVASTEELERVVRAEAGASKPLTTIEDAVEGEPESASHPFSLRPLLARWRAAREFGQLRSWLDARAAEGRSPLVWFGVHGGPYARCGIADLERVRGVLHDVDRVHPLSLTVISNSRERFESTLQGWMLPHHYLEWSGATFFDAMRRHAVAILPITPSPFTRCKSSNRPSQALLLGLAVVADSIPSYEPLRSCTRLDDWERGLVAYLLDPSLRARDIAAGQALVRQRWSLARIADRWQQLFTELLHDAAAPGSRARARSA